MKTNSKIRLIKKYLPLFQSNSRYFVVTGGRGSGKSHGVNSFLTLLSYELNHTILFARKTLTSAHVSIIPEFIEKIQVCEIDDHFVITKTEIENNVSKSKIIFKGIQSSQGDNTANLKSLHNVSSFILDEAEELTDESTFDKIDFSVRNNKVQNRIIIILNPTSKAHWIYKRFFESVGVREGFNGTIGNTTYIHTTYLDNIKHLSKTFLQRVEELKRTNIDKFNHIILGGWLDKADGVIFKNWEFGDFDNSLPYSYGLDFGFFPDPDVLTKIAIDNKKMLIYWHEEIYAYEQSTSELVINVKAITANKTVIADSAGNRAIEDLRRGGVNVIKAEKPAGSVLDGINKLRNYKIVVTHTSINLAKELNNYTEKNGQPIDAYNHGIDGMRYNVMYFTKNIKPHKSRILN